MQPHDATQCTSHDAQHVVAACGTGKTFIAATAALRLARGERVLVLLPTLDLLTQTAREWRTAGHAGPAVAVCSLEDNAQLYGLEVRTTTSAPQLALWHGRGPVTVYATYASLPVIAEAHRGEYGLTLEPFVPVSLLSRWTLRDIATHSFHTQRRRPHSASRAARAVDDKRSRKAYRACPITSSAIAALVVIGT